MNKIAALAMLALCATAENAHSMDMTIDPKTQMITLTGDIVEGDAAAFKAKFGDNVGKQVVSIVSNGGTVIEAMLIGEYIHDRGWLTYAPDYCYSACSVLWMAGAVKGLKNTSKVGFHAAYDADTKIPNGMANAMIGSYLTRLGYSYVVIMFATKAPPTSMEMLTEDLAQKLGLAIEVVPDSAPATTATQAPAPKPAPNKVKKAKS